ncbi:ATP-binding protein [Streptomyces gilvus]|uniref:ATP-binding protein n=1 Tax=Streptomyces gilvus TaxID=2920937 RepID=UPI001F0E05AE|nr:ATP-binding protein [Streptomyces sp. CME 23]MCH5671033.1 ATP-binding protein [Streptomyces sp. CME 23]
MSRDVLAWCLVAVTAIAVAVIVVLVVRNRALGERKRQTEASLTSQLNAAQTQVLSVQAALQKYQQEFDGTIREAEEASEESTKAVLKGSARFLQGLAAEQMAVLEELQRKYGGHAVLADLLEVTHANAQMQRKSQGIAVLCGAPVGRRNRAASVYDVVRSAQSQIRSFRRVEIMQQTGFALKASAVSPVSLAVAELLDNAASFSQQDAPIEVTFQRVQRNLCIIIDDAGVGMNDEDRQRASALLSGDFVPRLSQLGTQPKFGFPLIGLLARQHGFRVDVTGVSRYGGVRAVVLLPEELWTEELPSPVDQAAPVSIVRGADGTTADRPRTVHGLPKRASRQIPVAGVPGQDGRAPTRGGQDAGRASGRSLGALGALQRGTLSGRNLDSASTEGSQDA